MPDRGDLWSSERMTLLDDLLEDDLPAAPRGITPNGPRPAPLSFAQRRLWFLHQLDPTGPAYNVPFALRLRGTLPVPVLRDCLTRVVARHEVLRSTFGRADDGQLVARVEPAGPVDLPVVDAADEDALRALLTDHARVSFDLARGLPLRATLVRLAPDDHVFAVTFHHIVFDGWSVGVLFTELTDLLRAELTGRDLGPVAPPIQYGDYAAWQRDTLTDEALADGLAYWRARLAGVPDTLALPTDRPRPAVPSYRGGRHPVNIPADLADRVAALGRAEHASVFTIVVAAFALLLSRYADTEDIPLGTPVAGRDLPETEAMVGCFINTLVLRTDLSGDPTFRDLMSRVRDTVLDALAHATVPFERVVDDIAPARDLSRSPMFQAMVILNQRQPENIDLPGLTAQPVEVDAGTAKFDIELDLWERADGLSGWLEYNADLFDPATAEALAARFAVVLERAVANPDTPISAVDPMLPGEAHRVLVEWNDTGLEHRPARADELIARAAEADPDRVAVIGPDRRLTYADLNQRATRLAGALRRAGAGPDRLVGVCLERTADLPVTLLAVWKAGAGYLPLDPAYPADRLEYMVSDARPVAIVVDGTGRRALADLDATLIDTTVIDAAGGTDSADRDGPAARNPGDLAYAIYTSGSTGRPKGVLVEHAQLSAFVAAMDQKLGTEPGVWLAVTSVSFDISVLELCWTLARGYTVVLHGGRDADLLPAPARVRGRGMEFSLFYFASDQDTSDQAERYRLLFDGARFADANGFSAVWSPERHFHAFGGLYPNPAVTAAALAMATERVHLRAGSVVLPLHHPVRVAEEWAVVDNFSGGRVGVSFASGWHANDFVFNPRSYDRRKDVMLEGIDTVRRLWRGEAVSLPGGTGDRVDVRIRPRPVQPDLPIWLTAAGSPATFEAAGRLGANLLTHLLGQNTTELAEKIGLYRRAYAEHHDGDGHVTLMLHTFVGTDPDRVRETVRGPFTEYLRSSANLMSGLARGLGMDAPDRLAPADMDALLAHAFDRYVESAGLFGTPASCLDVVSRLADAGVDEIGCLIDFGVPASTVLANLPNLAELRDLANPPARAEEDRSLPALIERYGVTHLQCVPSLAGALADNPAALRALGRLRVLLVGGEAFPAPLADRLRAALPGRLLDMYGPTETTIWSATEEIDGPVGAGSGSVPLGRPLANTRIYLRDRRGHPVPVGVPGEVHIGGPAVTRGYHGRPALTARRYVPDPYRTGQRLYATGDLARWRPDGRLEFLGRTDDQVKIRGFRVELGEVEAVLGAAPGVGAGAVTARGGRLVGYVTPAPGTDRTGLLDRITAALRARLPDYMVPATVVVLDALPLTPNGKVDRAALPDPVPDRSGQAPTAPRTELEATLAAVFTDVLGVSEVGVYDNFFDLGGDSILVIRAVDKAGQLGVRLAPRLLFSHQTVAALAGALSEPTAVDPAEPAGITGTVPLTPVQRWFFEQNLPVPDHYNHAMLVRPPRRPDRGALRTALRHVLAHHDGLRARFTRGRTGWEQTIEPADPTEPAPLEWFDLRDVPARRRPGAIEAGANQLQSSLDLCSGPLVRIGYFDHGTDDGRLLVVVHHLAVDGVSGRVLLEDLWTAYERAERGEPVSLPARTASPRQWAEGLVDRAARTGTEAGYWLGLDWSRVRPLPLDRPDGRDVESAEEHVTVGLDRRRTTALLREVTGASGVHVNDVLLAALGRAVARWAGGPVLVDVEGHGRHAVPDLDASRTVGWFTAVHPVLIDLTGTEPMTEAIEVTGALRRDAPDEGVGFGALRYLSPDPSIRDRLAGLPPAQIVVNYLGQFDQTLGPFRLATEPLGRYRDPGNPRGHTLVVNGYVADGRLRVDWAYCANLHDRATIQAVADDFAAGLAEAVTARPGR